MKNSLVTGESMGEIFVSKNENYDGLSASIKDNLEKNIGISGIKSLKFFNNYLVENGNRELFEKSKYTIFGENGIDDVYDVHEFQEITKGKIIIVLESKPGQYDARVDAIQQNIMLQTGENFRARYKKIIVLEGNFEENTLEKIKSALYNPTDSKEVSLEEKGFEKKVNNPVNHEIMNGFISSQSNAELQTFIKENGLSMNLDDVKMLHAYFKNEEKRDPSKAEILLIDTYWSDHCRHTTFNTHIKNIRIQGSIPLVQEIKRMDAFFKKNSKILGKNGDTFMEIAQASFRFLKNNPYFKGRHFIDVSIENNAASYKTKIMLENGKKEDWIIMFKNETHNSPTESEPFGGAATCLGGAIRDTLSGRAYTFAAMRVSGAKNPSEPMNKTLADKLSQRAISIGAALGYASYGNQIGLATTQVKEFFHPGYVAKRFECGYVLAGVKEENLKREAPKAGDFVIMFGGRTGRDGVGGANVSSKESGASSKEEEGAHVQKGNPVEERKFQRLMRQEAFTKMVKKSNDGGAGGVSVMLGELARGIEIYLDEVAKHTKYDGLSDVELILSESQERMSIVIDAENYDRVMHFFQKENIEAFLVGKITNNENIHNDRLIIEYKGKKVVNLSRDFLETSGASRETNATISMKDSAYFYGLDGDVSLFINRGDFMGAFKKQLSLLTSASQRGLAGQFDNSVGASTILAGYGGKYQNSPQIGMASKIPTFESKQESVTSILSTLGFNPELFSQNTYLGGIYSVIEAISKIVAMGGYSEKTWVSMQEYFGKLTSPEKYGEVYAGLLGTLNALMELKIAAIGGKDSMSGTYKTKGSEINVPPTIVTFANTSINSYRVVSAEFKKAGNSVMCLRVKKDKNGLPDWQEYRYILSLVQELIKQKNVFSSSVGEQGGIVDAIAKLSLGNKIGFAFNDISRDMFTPSLGDIILEVSAQTAKKYSQYIIGKTIEKEVIQMGNKELEIKEVQGILEGTLENVWRSQKPEGKVNPIPLYSQKYTLESKEILRQKPRALVLVFPGTNSELDTKHALLKAGFEVEECVFNTLSHESFVASRKFCAQALEKANLLVFPGGFSLGDEPDGSAKFIVNIMKSAEIHDAFQKFLDKKNSLTLGICNGFQALIKLGVFESGNIKESLAKDDETLIHNESLRHETGLVRLRVTSLLSPFLSQVKLSSSYIVPISHGEGKVLIDETRFQKYVSQGQIPLQYLDEEWKATNKYNGSNYGIAGLTSPDGRILGMMPHPERTGLNVFKNVPGEKLLPIFEGAYRSLVGK